MRLSLTALFGSVLPDEQVDEHSFEKFCEWKREKHQKTKNVQKASDGALVALSNWAARLSKVCLITKFFFFYCDVHNVLFLLHI